MTAVSPGLGVRHTFSSTCRVPLPTPGITDRLLSALPVSQRGHVENLVYFSHALLPALLCGETLLHVCVLCPAKLSGGDHSCSCVCGDPGPQRGGTGIFCHVCHVQITLSGGACTPGHMQPCPSTNTWYQRQACLPSLRLRCNCMVTRATPLVSLC